MGHRNLQFSQKVFSTGLAWGLGVDFRCRI